MKKYLMAIMMLGLLHGALKAQSELYKRYVDDPSVAAVCIENYPIGKGVRVPVTTLEAADSVTFNKVVRTLKMLRDTVGIEKREKARNEAFLQQSWSRLQAEVSFQSKADKSGGGSAQKKMIIDWFESRALPGDEGRYMVFTGRKRMTVLVIHYRDDRELAQASAYVLSLIKEGMEELKNGAGEACR